MTEDTKRAMEMIRPIAKELGICVNADDDWLLCDEQAIGIACNSTYATVVEFIAYCMYRLDKRELRFRGAISWNKLAEEAVKRYWLSNQLAMKLGKGKKEGEPDDDKG